MISFETFQVKTLPLNTEVYPDKVRCVCISDTHNQLGNLAQRIPPGDVLIHAGDITSCGQLREVKLLDDFLGNIFMKHFVLFGRYVRVILKIIVFYFDLYVSWFLIIFLLNKLSIFRTIFNNKHIFSLLH